MNSKDLLNKLSSYFDLDKKKRRKKTKELKELLKALKSKEKKLISKCDQQLSANEHKILRREIAIIHAKRKKGLKALKKLINT